MAQERVFVKAKQSLSPKNTKKASIALLILIVALIGAVSAVRQVNTGSIGVVTQYGKVTGRELDEGLSFVLPFGLNSVAMYDIKVQKETSSTQAATKDLQDVSAEVVLNYRLNRGDVSKVHQTVGVSYKDKLITPALSEVFKSASAQYNASELITARASLKKDVYEQLSERLTKYGIKVEDVSITNFKFSDSFAEAIEQKQVAQQNAERAKFNLEAAQTDAKAQKAQAETLSDAYLRKLAIEKWNGELPEYVGGGGEVMSIPIKK